MGCALRGVSSVERDWDMLQIMSRSDCCQGSALAQAASRLIVSADHVQHPLPQNGKPSSLCIHLLRCERHIEAQPFPVNDLRMHALTLSFALDPSLQCKGLPTCEHVIVQNGCRPHHCTLCALFDITTEHASSREYATNNVFYCAPLEKTHVVLG